MRLAIPGAMVAVAIILATVTACAGSQSQQLLTACEAHDAAIRALAPQAAVSRLTQGQVDAVDRSLVIADRVCSGEAQDFSVALATLEAELLRLVIIEGGK